MNPEGKSRLVIDRKLSDSGWTVQDVKSLNLSASIGVAVREFPTSTGPVDYALFVEGVPVGVVEAKKTEAGEGITTVEGQSSRYANSAFKWVKGDQRIRFAYEATDRLVRFTDYNDIKHRSRPVFSFHRPETLAALLRQPDTVRNNLKRFPAFDSTPCAGPWRRPSWACSPSSRHCVPTRGLRSKDCILSCRLCASSKILLSSGHGL